MLTAQSWTFGVGRDGRKGEAPLTVGDLEVAMSSVLRVVGFGLGFSFLMPFFII